eukprot:TRINITY_DN9144_c0_g1_i4.p1 TRINITY_DN9144_c0_g1~~TRINITY_DN9144_c0_g1_i4.p1  ORF type:complete len:433 (+),score=152.00 TRINITY_DN9144_c0_g1_i4:71-1300(+)
MVSAAAPLDGAPRTPPSPQIEACSAPEPAAAKAARAEQEAPPKEEEQPEPPPQQQQQQQQQLLPGVGLVGLGGAQQPTRTALGADPRQGMQPAQYNGWGSPPAQRRPGSPPRSPGRQQHALAHTNGPAAAAGWGQPPLGMGRAPEQRRQPAPPGEVPMGGGGRAGGPPSPSNQIKGSRLALYQRQSQAADPSPQRHADTDQHRLGDLLDLGLGGGGPALHAPPGYEEALAMQQQVQQQQRGNPQLQQEQLLELQRQQQQRAAGAQSQLAPGGAVNIGGEDGAAIGRLNDYLRSGNSSTARPGGVGSGLNPRAVAFPGSAQPAAPQGQQKWGLQWTGGGQQMYQQQQQQQQQPPPQQQQPPQSQSPQQQPPQSTQQQQVLVTAPQPQMSAYVRPPQQMGGTFLVGAFPRQ